MKKFFCIVLALILLSLSLVSCTSKEEKALLEVVSYSEEITNYVVIEVDKFGYIVVELYPDVAPETVENFQSLVDEGFYDGLIFHRVIKGFMIQGGDPDGNGTGGSDENIKGEFSDNGFENNLSHKRGVVSMARQGHSNPTLDAQFHNSASSQFFICQKAYDYGNGDYAAFGFAAYGMDVVDKIARVRTNANDKPYVNVVMESVEFATVG